MPLLFSLVNYTFLAGGFSRLNVSSVSSSRTLASSCLILVFLSLSWFSILSVLNSMFFASTFTSKISLALRSWFSYCSYSSLFRSNQRNRSLSMYVFFISVSIFYCSSCFYCLSLLMMASAKTLAFRTSSYLLISLRFSLKKNSCYSSSPTVFCDSYRAAVSALRSLPNCLFSSLFRDNSFYRAEQLASSNLHCLLTR